MIFITIVPGDVTNTSKPPLRKVPSTSPDMISSTPKTTTIPKTDGHQETATLQPSTTLEISSSPTRQDVALQVRIMSRHGKFIERGFSIKALLIKLLKVLIISETVTIGLTMLFIDYTEKTSHPFRIYALFHYTV